MEGSAKGLWLPKAGRRVEGALLKMEPIPDFSDEGMVLSVDGVLVVVD